VSPGHVRTRLVPLNPATRCTVRQSIKAAQPSLHGDSAWCHKLRVERRPGYSCQLTPVRAKIVCGFALRACIRLTVWSAGRDEGPGTEYGKLAHFLNVGTNASGRLVWPAPLPRTIVAQYPTMPNARRNTSTGEIRRHFRILSVSVTGLVRLVARHVSCDAPRYGALKPPPVVRRTVAQANDSTQPPLRDDSGRRPKHRRVSAERFAYTGSLSSNGCVRILIACMCDAHFGKSRPKRRARSRLWKTCALYEFLHFRSGETAPADATATHGRTTVRDDAASTKKQPTSRFGRECPNIQYVSVRASARNLSPQRHVPCHAQSYSAPGPPTCRLTTITLGFENGSSNEMRASLAQ
jgi:hypothetical protein